MVSQNDMPQALGEEPVGESSCQHSCHSLIGCWRVHYREAFQEKAVAGLVSRRTLGRSQHMPNEQAKVMGMPHIANAKS